MAETITITLAGVKYEIPRLNLAQLEELQVLEVNRKEIALAEYQRLNGGGEETAFSDRVRLFFDHNKRVVAAGLSAKYPDLGTPAALGRLMTTPDEITVAAKAIAAFSAPQEEGKAGE